MRTWIAVEILPVDCLQFLIGRLIEYPAHVGKEEPSCGRITANIHEKLLRLILNLSEMF